MNVSDALLALSILRSDFVQPLNLNLKVNLFLQFEFRIRNSLTTSNRLVHSILKHSTIETIIVENHSVDSDLFGSDYYTNLESKMFEVIPLVFSKMFNEYRVIPVPVKLPYPFDIIFFRDFDLEVREKEWWLGLDLSL